MKIGMTNFKVEVCEVAEIVNILTDFPGKVGSEKVGSKWVSCLLTKEQTDFPF